MGAFCLAAFPLPLGGIEGGIDGYGMNMHPRIRHAVNGPGEQMDIEPGGWLYKDPSVRMETQYQGLKTGFFASAAFKLRM